MRNQWQWLENWLAKNAPEVIDDLNNGCSLEQLLKLESEMDLALPESFKDFYLIDVPTNFFRKSSSLTI